MIPRIFPAGFTASVLVILLGGLVTGSLEGQSSDISETTERKVHELKLDADKILQVPALWDLTPEKLTELCPEEGFTKNPFFRWTSDESSGNRIAYFSRQPFSNVVVDAGLFGGKAKVNTLVIEFKANKPTSVLVVLGDNADELGGMTQMEEACVANLAKMFEAQPVKQARYYGSLGVRTLRTQTFEGKSGTACLDFSEEKKLVRFSLAPPGTKPATLLAQPVIELDQNATELYCNLDGLLKFPQLWDMTPKDFEAVFGVDQSGDNPIFQWLNAEKTAVRFARQPYSNVSVDLRIFNGKEKVEEAVLEFKGGKLSQVSVSLYNRGDSGQISKEEFDMLFKKSGQALIGWLGARPVEHRGNAPTAVKTTSWLWNTPHTLVLLEYNTEATQKKAAAEFLRLRMAPAKAREELLNIAAIGQTSTTLGRSELLQFVKKESNGDVVVSGIPMVDQGAKGYCVVASCERLFGYLNIPCDQHELASIAGSEADRGTNGDAFVDALKKINTRFKVRFKALLEKAPMEQSDAREARPDRFAKMIQEQVDRGVPLLWALQLGLFPEEPDIAQQAGGGHMRLIIGYNTAREEVLFTDSWGAGHELKRMKLKNALSATMGIYLVEPKAR